MGTQLPSGVKQAPRMAGGPKQLILIYSGETLSIPETNRDYNPPEGGLPALAHQILSYESVIMDFTRARVASEGGDPGQNQSGGLLDQVRVPAQLNGAADVLECVADAFDVAHIIINDSNHDLSVR